MPTVTEAPDERDLLDEARHFIRDNLLALVAAAGAMLLAYGFALTSFSVSIDEETRFLGDRTFIWFEQGRPTITLVKFFLGDTLPLPFFSLALSLAFLYAGGVIWAFLFVHAARLESRRRAGLLAFLVVFVTLPVNAYWLTFGTLNIESALAVVWSATGALCAWLWAIERRGWPWLAGAVVLFLLAVGTYQAFAVAALAGVLIAQLVSLVSIGDEDDEPPLTAALRQTARLVAPVVVVLMLAIAINYVLVDRGGYTEDTYIAWGNAGVRAILRRLAEEVGSYLTGTGFAGGWVLIPSIIAAIVVFVATIVRGWRRRSWYPVLLLVIIFALPFALSAMLGTPLPNRALKALPLVAAGVWMLLAFVLPHGRALTAGLLAVAMVFAVWNGSIVTRLFVSEQLTYEADLRIATQIVERLEQGGWNGEPIPLVVVGRRQGGPAERLAVDETFGNGFFWRSQGLRAPGFMQAFGFPVRVPSVEERAAGAEAAEDMPGWPAHGSVQVEDGVAIVKFSDPPRAR